MKKKLNKKSHKFSFFVWVGFLGSAFTIIYISIYVVSLYFSDPRITFVLQGQHPASKLIFPRMKGMFMFEVSTKQNRSVVISKIEILYNSVGLELYPLDTDDPFKTGLSNDQKLPFMLTNDNLITVDKTVQLWYGFNYILTDTSNKYRLSFRAVGKVADTEWGFPLNLFSPSPKVCSQEFDLSYFDISVLPHDKQLDYQSIPIAPKEMARPVGSLIKRMNDSWMRANRDSATYQINSLTQ